MDPNGIVGTPTEAQVWLAPDWSISVNEADVKADPKKKPPGATLVRTRTTLYNDGRKVTVVLDRDGMPLTAAGTPAEGATDARPLKSTTDPDQQRIFGAAAPKKSGNVYVGTNPSTGKPSQVSEYPDPSAPGGVRKEYDDTAVPASAVPAKPSTEPPKTEDRGGRHYVWYPNPPSVGGGVWKDEGPAPLTPAERTQQQADAGQSGRVPKVIGGKAYDVVTTVTTGPAGEKITEQHYEDPAKPGVPIPTPLEPSTSQGVPNGSRTTQTRDGKTTKTTSYLQPDGTTRTVVDTAQQPPKETDVRTDASTGRRYELIRNDDGTVKGEREIPQTGGTPSYTYPEIKLAYGNIANEVMAISRDIYSRVGVGPGKLTKEEADRLFKPIYDQAQLRVSELNGIVSTQKSVWDSQVQTANQRLDAATRMAGQAIGMVKDVGMMAPGTGAVAGQAMWDMMHAQKAFAGGMGGLNDPALPGYLQGAMGMGPDTAAAPGGQPAAVPGSSVQAAAAGGPNALGLGAIGDVPAPAVAGSGGLPGADPAMAAAEAARQQAVAASITSDAGGVPTAGEPGGPALAPGPVWQPPSITAGAAAPPARDDWPTNPGASPVNPPAGEAGNNPSAPVGYLNPATGGGVTINIGGQPQNGGAAITGQPQMSGTGAAQNYLQPTQQEQRPSLASMQRGLAGSLLDTFSQDAVEAAWQQHAGGSLLGGGMG